MYQLRCKDLCVGYETRPVLKNLNLDICAGEYLCIVGENGSGKSTFMKTVLGLIPPVAGSISYGDGLKKNENRIFATADHDTERFSCFGKGSGSVRLPGKKQWRFLLWQRRKTAGRSGHGKNADRQI